MWMKKSTSEERAGGTTEFNKITQTPVRRAIYFAGSSTCSPSGLGLFQRGLSLSGYDELGQVNLVVLDLDALYPFFGDGADFF